ASTSFHHVRASLATVFLYHTPSPPTSTLFPYTTLFRSQGDRGRGAHGSRRSRRLPRARVGDVSRNAARVWCATARQPAPRPDARSEEHTSELQSRENLVCRLLLEKKKRNYRNGPFVQPE